MSPGRIFLGLLLVAGGLLWLAAGSGWLHPDWQSIHVTVARVLAWWPLLLVATGLGILVTRRASLWLGLLALVGGLLVALWVVSATFVPWVWFDSPGRHVTRVGRPDATIEAARLNIDATVASLAVSGGAGGDALAVMESSLPGLSPRAQVSGGDTGVVNLESVLPLAGAVRLDPLHPWRIGIDAPAVQLRLDLDEVVLDGLRINAASARLVGSIGQVVDGARIVVHGAFADTRLEFPAGVGVEVRVDGTSGRLDLPGFVTAGEGWRSANWDEARVRVVVDLRAAAYRLSIRFTDTYSTTVTQPAMPPAA